MSDVLSTAGLGLTQDHLDLRDSVRALAQRHVTASVVREAIEAEQEQLPAFWKVLAEDGLLGLHLAEEHDGAGYGLLELAVVVEELARHLTPGPFLTTTLTSAVLQAAGHTEHLAALAAGEAIGAVALSGRLVGSPVTGPAGDGLRVSGATDVVLGAVLADVLVVPVAVRGQGTRWVVLPRSAAQVAEQSSHDPTRRLASVTLEDITISAYDVLAVDEHLPLDLAATLFAAEATGLAARATAVGTDYARTRVQFGRPIGQFQAVKHRLARMLARTEQARACAWDAARSQDSDATPQEAALAAAVAGATAVDAAVSTAKDCIDTLGGIGFSWEHDAGFVLRRAQSLRLLLGPTSSWHCRVAALVGAGARRELRADLPPEAEQVRVRVRSELAPAAGLEGRARTTYLAERGYTAPHLPQPWGKGADAVTQLVVAEELDAAGLETHDMVIGNWVVPTLIAHGDHEQQERWVPPSLSGDLVWCQLFSEPGAGSDLAALSTRAVKVEGGWLVNGQKVWTSGAHQADYGILLARTDPTAPKHRGLSYFVVDMTSPGIEIRPLRELTGDALFNEVFLDDLFVPDEGLVGRPGEGWALARTTLANERVSMTRGSTLGVGGEQLLALAGDEPGELRSATLGQILCDAQSGSLLGLRQTLRALSGAQPGPESSIQKLLGVSHIQQVWETAMTWQGPAALTGDPEVRDARWRFLSSRSLSIAGGTTDIQLNIIGERILGLPRDPEPRP